MTEPFDTDSMGDHDSAQASAESAPDDVDSARDEFDDLISDDAAGTAEAGDEFEAGPLETNGDFGDAADDDMALWNAFEEEIADGLDAADEDEFLGRLLGALGRGAGIVGRSLGRGAGIAGGVASVTEGASRTGQGASRVPGAVTPAALAAAKLAQILGVPRVAGAHDRESGGLTESVGQTAEGARDLMAHLSRLVGQGGSEFDDFEAVADLMEDGMDAALPAAVALAARAAARGLGFRNITQLTDGARRALVRGVAIAARELIRGRGDAAMRALPSLARSAARVASRRAETPQRAAQTVRRHLPHTARRVAQSPRTLRRLRRSSKRRQAPVARDPALGRGRPNQRIAGPRTFYIDGPAKLTITPR